MDAFRVRPVAPRRAGPTLFLFLVGSKNGKSLPKKNDAKLSARLGKKIEKKTTNKNNNNCRPRIVIAWPGTFFESALKTSHHPHPYPLNDRLGVVCRGFEWHPTRHDEDNQKGEENRKE